eukprot:SAG31_NODE_2776_length_5105_cov_2.652817_3_plen_200_part_00
MPTLNSITACTLARGACSRCNTPLARPGRLDIIVANCGGACEGMRQAVRQTQIINQDGIATYHHMCDDPCDLADHHAARSYTLHHTTGTLDIGTSSGVNTLDSKYTKFMKNAIFMNAGDGEFRRVANTSFVTDTMMSYGLELVDVDSDGDLDILVRFISRYVLPIAQYRWDEPPFCDCRLQTFGSKTRSTTMRAECSGK